MYAGVSACQRILTAAVMLNFSALTLLLQGSCAVYNREVSGFSGGVLSVLVFWACFCWVYFLGFLFSLCGLFNYPLFFLVPMIFLVLVRVFILLPSINIILSYFKKKSYLCLYPIKQDV
jgi:phosphoglycerol transferase MdoB-like AlkP superfamily enzyme